MSDLKVRPPSSRGPIPQVLIQTLKLPMGATLRANVLVSLIGVNDFHAGAIPIERLSQLSGDISQEKSFGDQSREFEIATGFCFSALGGVEPLSFIAG